MKKKIDDCDLLNMPNQLFKYYSFNPLFNEQRLKGEIYLANAYQFNDPMDCQLDVINNTNDITNGKESDWLKNKLLELELDFKKIKLSDILSKLPSDKDNGSYVKAVREKQLEKLGILCLTSEANNILMWGYYTNNEGFCIEYDPNKIVHDIVIGFINNMEYALTRHLFEKMSYYLPIRERCKNYSDERYKATDIFTEEDIGLITNKFLSEQKDKDKVINFIKNIYIKRIGANSISYGIDPNDKKPTLFFDQKLDTAISKYYKKTKKWAHEKGFRITVSLGGKKTIILSKDCIKSVRCGCNMSRENILDIAYLLYTNKMNHIGLYRMNRNKTKGLTKREIKMNNLIPTFKKIDTELKRAFHEK